MAAILRTFWNEFPSTKMYKFRLQFYWVYLQGSNEQYPKIGSDTSLAPTSWISNDYFSLVYMRHLDSMS